MSRINPLYLLLLAIIITVFISYKTNVAKEQLEEKFLELETTTSLAEELFALKQAYDPKKGKLQLLRIVRSKMFQKEGLQVAQSTNKVTLEAKQMGYKSVATLLTKLLNKNFPITKLDLVAVDESNLHLRMEIQW